VVPAQHDHGPGLSFASTTGSAWLWVLVLAGMVTVTSTVLLAPVVPVPRHARLAAAAAAGGVVLLLLMLAPELDLPRPAVALLAATTGFAAAAARYPRDAPGPAWVRAAGRVAQLVVAAATAGAGVELARAWSGAATVPLQTGLFLGLVGLSWLVVCRPRSRPVAVALHGAGWLLANAVLGAATVTALAAV
jgi:hypothetical protein